MKKLNSLLFFGLLLFPLTITSCGGKQNSEHQNHEADAYGFCKEGKEWLGEDLLVGVNMFTIDENASPLFLRVDLANFTTNEIPIVDITDNSTVQPYDIKTYIVIDGAPVFSSEIAYFEDAAFCNKLVGDERVDYLYYKLDYFSGTGIFGIVLASMYYEPVVIHNPNDYGFCLDCGEYLGDDIDINVPSQVISTKNEMKTSSGKMRAFYRFAFSDGKDYEMLRGNYDCLAIAFTIKTGETTFEEVDLKELVSSHAFEKSTDKKVYLSVYKKNDNLSAEETLFQIKEYFHVDECGFDEKGVYHGVDYDKSVGLDNTAGITYLLGYKWYVRYKNITAGSTFSFTLFNGVFQYKYYIRSLTGETKEVTDVSTKAPITMANQDGYEAILYIVITKYADDGYGHLLTIWENKCEHSQVDENGFCESCGVFTGEEIEVGASISGLNMSTGEVKFYCFKVTPGASYYKLVTNFSASEFEFFAFDKTTHAKISVSVPSGESNAVAAVECLDNTYYLALRPTASTSNGSFTIYKVS